MPHTRVQKLVNLRIGYFIDTASGNQVIFGGISRYLAITGYVLSSAPLYICFSVQYCTLIQYK